MDHSLKDTQETQVISPIPLPHKELISSRSRITHRALLDLYIPPHHNKEGILELGVNRQCTSKIAQVLVPALSYLPLACLLIMPHSQAAITVWHLMGRLLVALRHTLEVIKSPTLPSQPIHIIKPPIMIDKVLLYMLAITSVIIISHIFNNITPLIFNLNNKDLLSIPNQDRKSVV